MAPHSPHNPKRPTSRKNAGGVGPGPAYRPSTGGGGKIHKGSTRPSGGGGGGGKKNDGCCPMVAAVRSVKQGKFRLARRYAVMSLRLSGRFAVDALAMRF